MPERIKPTAWGDLAGYSAYVPDAEPGKPNPSQDRANVAGEEVVGTADAPPAHKHKNDPDHSSSGQK
jgi:hypothetical protein